MKSVYCIASNRTQADSIVDRLKNAHFPADEIWELVPHSDMPESLNIPEFEAVPEEDEPILVAVNTKDLEEFEAAEKIFTEAGAQEVCSTGLPPHIQNVL